MQAGEGEFFVNAKLRNARYDYAPSYLAPKAKPWPAFEQLDAELSFNRASLQISNARAQIAGRPGLLMQKTQARIASLGPQSSVEVSGEIRGPPNPGLPLVPSPPLSAVTRKGPAHTNSRGPGRSRSPPNLPCAAAVSPTAPDPLQGMPVIQ